MYSEITASNDTILDQAPKTVSDFFSRSIDIIDSEFGKGFAKEHPQLVGQLVGAMTNDRGQMFTARALEKVAVATDGLSNPIDRVADAITVSQ